tara:strand:- start:247 stop:963 length:717 start_codon:yes stop_codon:yes gene_type:complete
MKQLLEDWKRFLKEEEQPGEGIELYHATLSGENNEILNSFIKNGIDTQRAAGFGQGKGFYLWTDKKDAQHYIKGLIHGMTGGAKEVEVKGAPIIITVDEPVTPENFDIDYEIFGKGFGQFIKQNIDYFSENDQALGLGRRAGKGVRTSSAGTAIIPNKKILGVDTARAINLDVEREYDVGEGQIFSLIAQRLSKLNPEMFKQFEEQFLSRASAIKYNGEKKIWPLRIEDAEGNILWSR